jgi:hypothetical protein
MAKGDRAFWSSLPGVLTGLAGILTAGFGLVGLSVSQGWIGDGGTGTEVVRINVDPPSLELRKLPLQDAPEETLEVLNKGAEPITVATEVIGRNPGEFRVDDADCTASPLPAGRTCEVIVSFDAGSGQFEATLVISANGGDQAKEVDLQGNSLL